MITLATSLPKKTDFSQEVSVQQPAFSKTRKIAISWIRKLKAEHYLVFCTTDKKAGERLQMKDLFIIPELAVPSLSSGTHMLGHIN